MWQYRNCESLCVVKDHVSETKGTQTSRRCAKKSDSKIEKNKKRIKFLALMLNGIFGRGFNKEKGVNVKIRKYAGVTSTDITD